MVITKKGNTEFEIHPVTPDPIRAVIVDVTEPEIKQTAYGPKERFALVFETEMLRDDGKPYVHWEHGFTPSLNEKAKFFQWTKKIMGFEPVDDFDTESLIGRPVKIIVEHKPDGEKVYANITYISGQKDAVDALRPTGSYTRKKDRDGGTTGAGGTAYTKIENKPAAGSETDWMSVKVHVGQFAGQHVSDLPSKDAAEKLLQFWWPSVQAKPSADDKRLHAALLKAMEMFKSLEPAPTF